jgi:hypothetical protein
MSETFKEICVNAGVICYPGHFDVVHPHNQSPLLTLIHNRVAFVLVEICLLLFVSNLIEINSVMPSFA